MTREGKIALITSHLMAVSEQELDSLLESVSAELSSIRWDDLDAETQASLERGIADAEAGRVSSSKDVFERLYAKIEAADHVNLKEA